MPLEVLHFPLVLFSGGAGTEGAQVAAFVGARVQFARVKAVLSGAKLADHRNHLDRARTERALRVAAALRALALRAEAGRDAAACPPRRPPFRIGEWSSGFP